MLVLCGRITGGGFVRRKYKSHLGEGLGRGFEGMAGLSIQNVVRILKLDASECKLVMLQQKVHDKKTRDTQKEMDDIVAH